MSLNPYWTISNAPTRVGYPYVLSRGLIAPLPSSIKHRPTVPSSCDAPPLQTSGSWLVPCKWPTTSPTTLRFCCHPWGQASSRFGRKTPLRNFDIFSKLLLPPYYTNFATFKSFNPSLWSLSGKSSRLEKLSKHLSKAKYFPPTVIMPLFSSVQPQFASATQSFLVYRATTETPTACLVTTPACVVCLATLPTEPKLLFRDR
jgi:hypothetical protein